MKKEKTPQPFILTKKNYFDSRRPHLSTSQINDYLRDPHYYYKKHVLKTIMFHTTDPMKRGSVVDMMLTDPLWFSRKKDRYFRRVLKKDNEVRFEHQKKIDDKWLVPDSIWTEAEEIAQEIQKQPFWEVGPNTRFQEVLTGEILGVPLCGLADRIDNFGTPDVFISDLKVVSAMKMSSPQKWLWNAKEMGYLRQMAMYQYLLGVGKVPCFHIVASYEAEGLVRVKLYKIPQAYLDEAWNEITKAVQCIKEQKFAPSRLTWEQAEALPDLFISSESPEAWGDFEGSEEAQTIS